MKYKIEVNPEDSFQEIQKNLFDAGFVWKNGRDRYLIEEDGCDVEFILFDENLNISLGLGFIEFDEYTEVSLNYMIKLKARAPFEIKINTKEYNIIKDPAAPQDLFFLKEKIIEWGQSKGIICANNGVLPKGTPLAQAEKVVEEAKEVLQAVREDNLKDLEDAIGDTFVTIVLQAEICGLSFEKCIQDAYNVISKRSGKMIDGTFVKDTPET